MVFDLISPKHNKAYKYKKNEHQYPFELSPKALIALAQCTTNSRHLIPAASFKGSFLELDINNARGLFRSADWHDWLLYCFPTLVCSQLSDKYVRDGFLSLVRGIALSLQFSVNQTTLKEIEQYVSLPYAFELSIDVFNF